MFDVFQFTKDQCYNRNEYKLSSKAYKITIYFIPPGTLCAHPNWIIICGHFHFHVMTPIDSSLVLLSVSESIISNLN